MKNKTGVIPVEFKVLVKIERVDETTEGGLWIPEHTLEREEMAQDRGVLVEVSDMAFQDWKGLKPKAGDKVIFKKYAGSIIEYRNKDRRGKEQYRICNDKDIYGIIKEE